ncbi:MAG: hypothetical protein AAGK14_14625, partial [Verrucomicrobiota bacterium]
MSSATLLPFPAPELTEGVSLAAANDLTGEAIACTAETEKQGLLYRGEAGFLEGFRWISADFLSRHPTILAFTLEFFEPGNPVPAIARFTLLPKAQARLRFDLEGLKQNRWLYFREGACLKPTMSGGRVALGRVERVELKVLYKALGPAHWEMTPLTASTEPPPLLEHPVLPEGKLLDKLGQATWKEWEGKTRSEEELRERLHCQHRGTDLRPLPASMNAWGGWKERQFEATGFFRTHHDGQRWWLVDPDGHPFWSAGPCAVRTYVETNIRLLHDALEWLPARDGDFAACYEPTIRSYLQTAERECEGFDFLRANLIRVFGSRQWEQRWAEMVFPIMRHIGFNTCANWSSNDDARCARMPYVRMMKPIDAQAAAPRVFRDFPDVFDPAFDREAKSFAEQLRDGNDDPAMIGYFLMNEPRWAFTDLPLAEGMMGNYPGSASRRAFAEYLRGKYADDATLAGAWGMKANFDAIASAEWGQPFTEQARPDLVEFSTILVRRFYEKLNAACREADPVHLNLGARFSSAPKDWVADALSGFDVFSFNCYQPEPDLRVQEICAQLNVPSLIGEWHYGALDAGLPAPGIGHVATQADRGRAYRFYLETAAALDWCVGVHWFTLYDQSALGRNDGENYNIGFLDVCHRLYEPLVEAARVSHEQLYEVAAGRVAP